MIRRSGHLLILFAFMVVWLEGPVSSLAWAQADPMRSEPSVKSAARSSAMESSPAPSQGSPHPSEANGAVQGGALATDPPAIPAPTLGSPPLAEQSDPNRQEAARAHPILLDGPRFVFIPPSEPFFPGQPATLEVWLIDEEGTPRSAGSLKVNSESGRIRSVDEVGKGQYHVIAEVEDQDAHTEMVLKLRAHIGPRVFSASYTLQVQSAPEPHLNITWDRSRMVLGRDQSLRFEVRGQAADGKPLHLKDLTLLLNVGTTERLAELATGVVEGYFVPPVHNRPQVAILAGFLGQGAQQIVGYNTLPLIGTTEIPIRTEPNSTVWLEIGTQTYGPLRVGDSGTLNVPVEVPPGVTRMLLRIQDSIGNTSRSSQSLSPPRWPRAVLHLDRTSLRVDEIQSARVTIIAVTDSGEPETLHQEAVTVSDGSLGPLLETAPGLFSSTYLPASRPGRQEVQTILTRTDGGEEVYTVPVDIKGGIPANLEITVTPKEMRVDDPPAQIFLRVTDQAGNPTTGVRLRGTVSLGRLEPFRSVGPGEFVAPYQPPRSLEGVERDADGQVTVPIQVSGRRLASGQPPATLVAQVVPPFIPAGGETVPIVIQIWDRDGAPVEGVTIRARVVEGGGHVSEIARTDEDGLARLGMQPGRQVGLATIEVHAEHTPQLSTRLRLIQVAGNVGPRGAGRLGTARVGKSAPRTELAVKGEIRLRAGRVREIRMSALPNVLNLETQRSSRVRVRLYDVEDNFVIDPDIILRVSAGNGHILGGAYIEDGFYEAQYVPSDLEEPLDYAVLTVTNARGDYVGSTEIELVRKDARYIGAFQLGLASNLGAINSPSVSFAAYMQLPQLKPHIYAGVELGYYYFSATSDQDVSSIRADIFPLQLMAAYRHKIGRLTPFLEVGPSFVLVSAAENSSSTDPIRGLGVLLGMGGAAGLEVGLGPGGIQISLGVSAIRSGQLLDGLILVDGGLGGLRFRSGYAVHF